LVISAKKANVSNVTTPVNNVTEKKITNVMNVMKEDTYPKKIPVNQVVHTDNGKMKPQTNVTHVMLLVVDVSVQITSNVTTVKNQDTYK